MHTQAYMLLQRNLLYTAVTRAQESVILLGDRWGIQHCAQTQRVDTRNTFLSLLLVRARRCE